MEPPNSESPAERVADVQPLVQSCVSDHDGVVHALIAEHREEAKLGCFAPIAGTRTAAHIGRFGPKTPFKRVPVFVGQITWYAEYYILTAQPFWPLVTTDFVPHTLLSVRSYPFSGATPSTRVALALFLVDALQQRTEGLSVYDPGQPRVWITELFEPCQPILVIKKNPRCIRSLLCLLGQRNSVRTGDLIEMPQCKCWPFGPNTPLSDGLQ